jgi:hypothetical protein
MQPIELFSSHGSIFPLVPVCIIATFISLLPDTLGCFTPVVICNAISFAVCYILSFTLGVMHLIAVPDNFPVPAAVHKKMFK